MQQREMIIENGKIHVIKKEVEASISIEDFAIAVTERNNLMETKQLPVNCVKYDRTTEFERYYCHIPEDNYRFNYNGKLYIVRLPHTLLIFTFKTDSIGHAKEIKMLWTDDKELDLDSKNFFIPLLHNIHTNGSICSGSSPKDVKSQKDYVNKYLVNLFTTEFNNDLSSGKRTMNNVSADQNEYKHAVTDIHDLVQLWWCKLIHEHDVYVVSKPIRQIKRMCVSEWIKTQSY